MEDEKKKWFLERKCGHGRIDFRNEQEYMFFKYLMLDHGLEDFDCFEPVESVPFGPRHHIDLVAHQYDKEHNTKRHHGIVFNKQNELISWIVKLEVDILKIPAGRLSKLKRLPDHNFAQATSIIQFKQQMFDIEGTIELIAKTDF